MGLLSLCVHPRRSGDFLLRRFRFRCLWLHVIRWSNVPLKGYKKRASHCEAFFYAQNHLIVTKNYITNQSLFVRLKNILNKDQWIHRDKKLVNDFSVAYGLPHKFEVNHIFFLCKRLQYFAANKSRFAVCWVAFGSVCIGWLCGPTVLYRHGYFSNPTSRWSGI